MTMFKPDSARTAAIAAILMTAGASTLSATETMAEAKMPSIKEIEKNPRAKTIAALEKVVSLNIKESRLEDVMNSLSLAAGMPFEIFWGERSDETFAKDTLITITDKPRTVKEMLESVSRSIASQGMVTTWQVLEDGTLQFGTKDSLNQFQETKVYDVKDINRIIPNFTNAPTIDINQALQQGRGGSGGSPFQNGQDPANSPRQDTQRSAEDLVQLIQRLVESEQWKEMGGNGGTIIVFQGNLLIKAAPYIHRALQ